ncbi:glycosyltransferase family 88 protein [Legionella sp. km772]|uniref:glycosyltransferase family 88 protein n=1 Tax=Legionella sp. km772 TaxID=2498111 RepID=UPI000F8C5382|nr:glycosyltransferase family 88 protein [Legionella sp. km772]RUR05046.1 hypothetical protein ELY15_14800 [Legionella sp. km772]
MKKKRNKPNFFLNLSNEDNSPISEESYPYRFTTQNWTRIWFTTNPQEFLPQKNKIRIIDFLNTFPSRKIALIFDSRLLDEHGKEDFAQFKHELSSLNKANQINFYDFSEISFQQNLFDEELPLYELANIELTHLANGGNVAAASDIVRTLSKVFCLGIYTDFDVEFLPSQIEEFKTSSPFLFSVNGYNYCNDILAIHPKLTLKTELLKNYYKNILESYRLCREYNLEQREQLQREMTLDLMGLFEDEHRRLVEPAMAQLFYIINEKYEEYSSLPMSLLIRKACEEAIKNEENAHLKIIYKKIYMHNVMASAGPKALPGGMSYDEERDCKKLRLLVRGQVDLLSNDGGWIPSILASDKQPQKKDDQEKDESRTLQP